MLARAVMFPRRSFRWQLLRGWYVLVDTTPRLQTYTSLHRGRRARQRLTKGVISLRMRFRSLSIQTSVSDLRDSRRRNFIGTGLEAISSDYLNDQALQIMSLGNGQEDGMVLRLSAPFQHTQRLAGVQ